VGRVEERLNCHNCRNFPQVVAGGGRVGGDHGEGFRNYGG
jgi:hypothetical protein